MRTATLDLNSRGSFVDDLNSKPGIVMCRDALLHRSHEIQPAFFRFGEKANFFAFFSSFLTNFGIGTWHTKFPPKAMLPSGQCRVGPKEKKEKKISETGNRTPGICVTGRDVTNYTISESATTWDRTKDLSVNSRPLCQRSSGGVKGRSRNRTSDPRICNPMLYR